MDDIRRLDRRLFKREFLRPGRLFWNVVFSSIIAYLYLQLFAVPLLVLAAIPSILHLTTAYNESVRKRFTDKRFESLWNTCQDRLVRFEDVLKSMRREQIADLQEMPKTIRRVSHAIYTALRRADMIANEVARTERDLQMQPPAFHSPSHDPQAKELYRIADKNIAEYRSHFAGVMAGVHRAEAEAAVYVTTLDSLRMKMIGYRLVGKSPELSSHDFLEAMTEAKLQLQAIDKALDELELSPYPQMIAVMPPSIPEEVQARLKQSG